MNRPVRSAIAIILGVGSFLLVSISTVYLLVALFSVWKPAQPGLGAAGVVAFIWITTTFVMKLVANGISGYLTAYSSPGFPWAHALVVALANASFFVWSHWFRVNLTLDPRRVHLISLLLGFASLAAGAALGIRRRRPHAT